MHGRISSKLRWDLDQGLRDEDSNWIKVAGVGFEAQTQGLKRNRAPTAEGIKDRWRIPACGPPDLRLGGLQDLLVVRVLPFDQVLDETEEPLTLFLLPLLCRKFLRMARRIVHQRGEQHRAARCQRPLRPPFMYC